MRRFLFLFPIVLASLHAQTPCQVDNPTAQFSVPHKKTAGPLDTDPNGTLWRGAASAWIVRDCTRTAAYPALKTEVRGFWTDTHLYLLFICPYDKLNVFLPAQNESARNKLWDRDVVEVFLGDDWKNIRHYREFEVAPTGDWIDLAIDLDRNSYDRNWRSGWQRMGRIDEEAKRWYAAMAIPLKSVSEAPMRAGTRWRANLYRIEGEGPDSRERYVNDRFGIGGGAGSRSFH
jgi:hypothetical protein